MLTLARGTVKPAHAGEGEVGSSAADGTKCFAFLTGPCAASACASVDSRVVVFTIEDGVCAGVPTYPHRRCRWLGKHQRQREKENRGPFLRLGAHAAHYTTPLRHSLLPSPSASFSSCVCIRVDGIGSQRAFLFMRINLFLRSVVHQEERE